LAGSADRYNGAYAGQHATTCLKFRFLTSRRHIVKHSHRATLLLVAILPLGCTQGGDPSPAEQPSTARDHAPADEKSPAGDRVKPVPRDDGPTEADYPVLHNLLQVNDRIYSGAEPHGEKAFAALQRLGVKTVVSVDGARPDVETARKYGLRYVHIPIGYDGIDREAGLAFARLAKKTTGPLYVHCHHGRHRGPAAAAAVCVAEGDVDGKTALKILERAGTSKGYAGLWRDVERYQLPAGDEELPPLVEVAKVNSLASAMAKIDRAKDNLKLCDDAGWTTPKDHPDIAPAQEALLLKEGFHESGRHLAAAYDRDFKRAMAESERLAAQLEAALRSDDQEAAEQHFAALLSRCKSCHAEHRN